MHPSASLETTRPVRPSGTWIIGRPPSKRPTISECPVYDATFVPGELPCISALQGLSISALRKPHGFAHRGSPPRNCRTEVAYEGNEGYSSCRPVRGRRRLHGDDGGGPGSADHPEGLRHAELQSSPGAREVRGRQPVADSGLLGPPDADPVRPVSAVRDLRLHAAGSDLVVRSRWAW